MAYDDLTEMWVPDDWLDFSIQTIVGITSTYEANGYTPSIWATWAEKRISALKTLCLLCPDDPRCK